MEIYFQSGFFVFQIKVDVKVVWLVIEVLILFVW
jgi:hypothetical protein